MTPSDRIKSLLRSTAAGRRLAAPAANRLRELALAARAWRADRDPARSEQIEELAGGLPVPPPRLRSRVLRNASALPFLISGRNHQRFIADALARNGVNPGAIGTLLDFGCGCGRVLRWWPAEGELIAGTDVNPKVATWCERHLPHVSAQSNGPLPPLAYRDASFDLIYSISIFTHLPEDRQRPWIDELARLLKPGGHLLITVAGEAYRETLPPGDLERYSRGELIVHFDEHAGSNLCAVHHPPAYVREQMVGKLDLVEEIRGDPAARMRQDAYLLRRPIESGQTCAD